MHIVACNIYQGELCVISVACKPTGIYVVKPGFCDCWLSMASTSLSHTYKIIQIIVLKEADHETVEINELVGVAKSEVW